LIHEQTAAVGKRATLKKVFFRIGAITIGIGIAMLMGEIGLRLLQPARLSSSGRERDFFCRFDPELGWAPLQNITALHKRGDLSGLVHQNKYGLRGPDDMQLNKTDGKRRVLVLGDSYTWGYGVNQTELFSAPEVHGTNDEILNFGVSGYGTDQEYLFYQRDGTKFVADEVVVALNSYNNVAHNLAPNQYGYSKPYFTLENQQLILHTEHIRNSTLRSISSSLNHHSRVWNLLREVRRVLGNLLERSRGIAEAREVVYRPEDVSERDRAGVDLTIAILKKLKDAASAQKADFYVIFIPYKPHIDKRVPYNNPLVPLIAAGLTHAGITYREPYPEFLKAALAGVHLFNDSNHFGPEGHALFAKFLTHTEMAEASVNYYTPQ
jgi:lysophospholipase L1-like esterase